MLFPLFFPLLLLFFQPSNQISGSIRLCEVQGTCFKCPDGHYSHFVCRSNADCFSGENCVLQRSFCCPSIGHSKNENQTRVVTGTDTFSALCPDGSSWGRMCKRDSDCLFRDELCAEGKCCPSCRQRRLQALKELRSFGSSTGREIEGFIPQCNDDGKHFRPMQCIDDSGECFCADKFGRRQEIHGSSSRKTASSRRPLNCSLMREVEEADKEKNKEGLTKLALSRDRWADPQQQNKEADEEGNNEQLRQQHCSDPQREFRHCGSACPVSCATRTLPRCPQEQCMRGCFCRLPYVILDANDPFGSRCVLPAECPLLQFTPDMDQWSGGFFPANQPTKQRPPEKCRDPLKNFQSCGSACPAGCGRMHPAQLAECSAHCVPGCFCRVPYVLRDPLDLNGSECILPQQCDQSVMPQLPSILSTASETQLCLPDRNQSWTGCFSRKCARSCGEWPPFCVPDDCQPGCECQPPAVVKDKSALVWECILPENCPRPTKSTKMGKDESLEEKDKCEHDQRKEFLSCGTSCPLGCDRLDQPVHQCSPCVSGCFCRNGFVFANASDWRSSTCVPLSECPPTTEKGNEEKTGEQKQQQMFESATTITAIQRVDNNEAPSPPPLCPANSLDRGGQTCLKDDECGGQRKCCSTNGTASARCTCRDPNALWTDCGPLCPEFCAQSARRLCLGPCRPGCFCPPGFVKRSSDPHSECVLVSQCAVAGEESTDIADEEKTCGEALASTTMYTRDGIRIGRMVIRPERPSTGTNTRRIRLSGEFAPPGVPLPGTGLVLSVHQFSDTTINGCAGVGRPLRLKQLHIGETDEKTTSEEVEELPTARRDNGISFGLDQRVEWPDPIGQGTNPLIGHSVVLQQQIGDQRIVLGCAVLGIAPSC